jgi:hydroxymethylbilane synthase
VKPFIVGTRGSALALAQVELTRAALAAVLPDLPVEQKVFVTRGDQKLDLSLLRASEAGGKGLFTKELEDALLAGAMWPCIV